MYTVERIGVPGAQRSLRDLVDKVPSHTVHVPSLPLANSHRLLINIVTKSQNPRNFTMSQPLRCSCLKRENESVSDNVEEMWKPHLLPVGM